MKSFQLYTKKPDEIPEDDGAPVAVKSNLGGGIVGGVILLAVIWYFWGGGLQQQATSNMADINSQVATDAVQQYNIVKKGGSKVDACVQAGFVAAAYLQAKDEANYQQWKTTETKDCAAAGVSI